MKKLRKISSVMFTLAAIANNSLATTTQKVAVESETKDFGNIAILAVGALLICCVLFLGYKMDQAPKEENSIKKMKQPNKLKQPKQTKNNQIKNDVIEDITEKQESEIFGLENENDIPYEKEQNEFYEKDTDLDDFSLNEDNEYEDDDVSLFMLDENSKSSFESIDDDISFEEERKTDIDNEFNSTMVFNSAELNEPIKQDEEFELTDDNEESEEMEYTDPVEGLDEKIANLDDFENDKLVLKAEKQDAESFINELKKYEPDETEELGNFTTSSPKKSEKVTKQPKRYTKKKVEVLENVPSEEIIEVLEVNEPSSIGINFLEQMDANMKKDQENRLKKYTKSKKEKTEGTTKKSTRKKKE